MKIYAIQVEPNCQESPYHMFKDDDCYSEIIITGNRDFIGKKTKEFKTIESRLDDAYADICEFDKNSWFKNITEIIHHYFPPYYKRSYSTKEIKKWRENIIGAVECTTNIECYYCEILSMLTGKEYSHAYINGSCQGDWNGLYYPTSYGNDFVKNFEIEYFNTGTEVIIHDEENEPETAEDIVGFSLYCYTYDVKKEIAEYCGVGENDVIFYEVDGYSRTAKYKAV